MAKQQTSMGSIVPTISTASFKPLSLDEIMMVPLAKQAADDQLVMDMDVLDAMKTNALDADKTYVNAQSDALDSELAGIRDNLMTGGVDRGMINKFKALRTRKNKEFSVNGRTGQANAAYNQMQLNKKNIQNRSDLDAETKRLGLLEAEQVYTDAGGVLSDAQYTDFAGQGTIDYMAEAQKIGSQMNPQQIAGPLGLQYDADSGAYKDVNNKTVILTREQIQNVTYDSLKNDVNTMSYLDEQERLGRIPSAEDALKQAAISAGDIYQRNDHSKTQSYPAWANKPSESLAVTPHGQHWSSNTSMNSEFNFNVEYGIDEESMENVSWSEDGESLVQNAEEPVLKPLVVDGVTVLDEAGEPVIPHLNHIMYQRAKKRYDAKFEDTYDASLAISNMRKDWPLLQGNDPDTGAPYTDKKIYDITVASKQKMSMSASQVFTPDNVDNSYMVKNQTLLKSAGGGYGSFINKHISINGAEGDVNSVAKQLGMDPKELSDAIMGGNLMGMSPGHPKFPGANVVSFSLESDDMFKGGDPMRTMDVYITPDNKTSQAFSYVSEMNRAMADGDRFTKAKRTNKGMYSHISTDLNPATNVMDQYRIVGPQALTKDEYLAMQWVPNYEGSTTMVAFRGSDQYIKLTRDNVVQDVTNRYTAKWDDTASGKTTPSYLKQ
jgi:hypothetical protein